jgi:hypothetical protein
MNWIESGRSTANACVWASEVVLLPIGLPVLGDQLRQPAEQYTSKRLERLMNMIEGVEGRTDP